MSVQGELAQRASSLLRIEDLRVRFRTVDGVIDAVRGVSFDVAEGEVVGLVGESGSGKSVTAMATLGLLAPNAEITSGAITYQGRSVLGIGHRRLRRIKGREIAVVFQDPMSSFNPVMSIGWQLREAITAHDRVSRKAADARAVELLTSVGIGDPARRLRQFPHEFSGGMRQRVMIAIAMANRPKLVIADEPTTALDVTVQAQVIRVLTDPDVRQGAAMLLITHDLGLVAERADRVVVMNGGRVMEEGSVSDIFYRPSHPYTSSLLAALPRLDRPLEISPVSPVEPSAAPTTSSMPCGADSTDAQPLLRVEGLQVHFPLRTKLLRRERGAARAVDGVDLEIAAGETLGLVGESGSGKSTTSRAIMGMLAPTGGRVVFRGRDITTFGRSELAEYRRRVQFVFQDPFASLNPKLTVREVLCEPMEVQGIGTKQSRLARAAEVLEEVGLLPEHARRYPHEFSGGQRQRIGIARALTLSPELLLLDEPVSALDVTIQAQVVKLLKDIQAERGIAYLFVAHDLAVVRDISARVAVMHNGVIVESGPTAEVFANPRHEYTRTLLDSVPIPDPDVARERAAVRDAAAR